MYTNNRIIADLRAEKYTVKLNTVEPFREDLTGGVAYL